MNYRDKKKLEEIILKNYDNFYKAYEKQYNAKYYNYYLTVYKDRKIIDLVLANSPKRVIDLGCGNNVLIRSLSEYAPDVECYAGDIIEREIKYGISCGSNVHFFTFDILGGAPFANSSFDVAISLDVIEHLDEPDKLFLEAARLLRPGGRFIVSSPNSTSIPYYSLRMMGQDRRNRWLKGQEHLHPEFCSVDYISPEVHRVEGFSRKTIARLGHKAGLRLISTKTHGMPFTGSPRYNRVPPRFLKWMINHHDWMIGLPGLIAVFKK